MLEMLKISVARILVALMLLCHLSIAQFLGLSFPDIVPGLDCLVGYDDNCGELPDGTVPFLVKMCYKGGPKQIDCREVLKNIDPVGTKKDAYCNISSKDSVGPVCFFNGAEYSVNDKNEVKLEASGTRTANADAASSATATSTLLFATATNYGSKTTHKTFFPNTTTSSESSSSSNDDDATRTTDASTITTDSSSMETVLRSTKDVTVTIPPPAASTAANAPPRSASAARGSLMANGVVGSLVVAFLAEICFLVLFDID